MSIGAGKSEVQDLRHDVGRLKVEQKRGEGARQPLPQFRHVFRSRAMFAFFQSDQNLAIEGADGGAVAKGKVERLSRASDIIQNEFNFLRRYYAPQFFLHVAENQLSCFPGAFPKPPSHAAEAGRHPR